MTPKQKIIINISNEIATQLLKEERGEKKLVLFDPISVMIVSTIINIAIQILIPIIQKKCKQRAENIKNGSASPSILMKIRAKLALRQAENKSGSILNSYGITTKDAYTAIFNKVKDLDAETIHYVVYEEE
jgi:hypothetical protein